MNTEETGWGVFIDGKMNNIIHIYPLDEKHSQGIISGGTLPLSNCSCMPKVKWNEVKGTWIMVHGAFDGREAIEEVSEILKQNY